MRTHHTSSIVLAAGLWMLASAGTGAAATEDKPPVGKEYKLVWSDEFTGEELDPGKWDYRQLGPRRDAANVKETVTLDGKGHLILTTRRSGDQVQTAMIGTQGLFETTFGYFECRVKLQEQVGHWSAFWLQTPTMGQHIGDPARAGTEIDIFEYLRREGDLVHHNLHWDGYGEHHKHAGTDVRVPGLGQGWNTFGLLWTHTEYVFTINGQETWRTTRGVSQRDQYIILSLEVGKWAGDIADATLPDHLYVDYVRVYQKAPATPAKPDAQGRARLTNRRETAWRARQETREEDVRTANLSLPRLRDGDSPEAD